MTLSFADVWEAVADALPDAQAQVHGDRRSTWSQLDRRADGIARTLLDAGAQQGDKVAQYLYNGGRGEDGEVHARTASPRRERGPDSLDRAGLGRVGTRGHQGAEPDRLLQGRGQDSGHVRGDRGRALLDPG